MRRAIYSLFLMAAVVLSCESVIELDLPEHEPLLVANSIFSSENVWLVHVSNSVEILSSDVPQIIDFAVVNIWEGERLVDQLVHVGDGIYIGQPGNPMPGASYTLDASASGFEDITATASLPVPVPIESLSFETVPGRFSFDSRDVVLELTFTDPPDVENFYRLDFRASNINSLVIIPTFSSKDETIILNDPDSDILDEEEEFFGREITFDDGLFEGETITLAVTVLGYDWWQATLPGRQLQVRLSTLSDELYQYQVTSGLQADTEDNPFAEPVQVYDNIENGHGIFAGYSVTSWNIFP